MQVGMEAFAPHPLRRLKNALFSRLASPAHSRAGRRSSSSTAAVCRGRGIAPAAQVQKAMNPKAGLFAHDVRIISRRHEADCLGGTRVEIARGVYALLDHVGRQGRFVVDDHVVRRFDRALKTRVCLEVEIKVQHRRHAFVDHCARTRVPVSVGEFGIGGVEARVVSLAADDDT